MNDGELTKVNAFELLCGIARKRRWCWKLSCTTCGCHHFKLGLYQISLGKRPTDSDWIDPESPGAAKAMGAPHSWKDWVDGSVELQEILVNADLKELSRVAGFPDFLGYLGVTLMMTINLEAETKALTNAWCPQLMKMVPSNSASYLALKNVLETPKPILFMSPFFILTWQMLSGVERDMKQDPIL